MLRSKYVKIAVPAVVTAIVAMSFSFNAYANKSKSTTTPQVRESKDQNAVGGSFTVATTQKPTNPDAEKPEYQSDDFPETLLVDVKGSDFEQDKRIVPSSMYGLRINGKETEVVTGHYRTFDSEGSGKLIEDDKQDGVIAVWIRGEGVIDYKVYHTPQKNGELRIVSVKDKNLFNLIATDGTKFTFDLKNRTLTKLD